MEDGFSQEALVPRSSNCWLCKIIRARGQIFQFLILCFSPKELRIWDGSFQRRCIQSLGPGCLGISVGYSQLKRLGQ